MVLQFIDWNVNPEIFRIGNFALRWYGLLFASGFFFGYLILAKFFKKEGISIELLDKLTIYTAVGTIIGARLGHCLFYGPHFDILAPNGVILVRGYLSHPLDMLKVWQGGLASHGAAVGIPVAIYFFSKNTRRTYLWTFDRLVIVVALAGFFIRTGNLMNSEIYGIETSLPWGFVFLRNGEIVPKHPTQIYEALCYLVIFLLLYFVYVRKRGIIKDGAMFGLFLFLVFTSRFFIEFIKEDQVRFESGMNFNMGQWLSIPFILTGVFLWARTLKMPAKSGD